MGWAQHNHRDTEPGGCSYRPAASCLLVLMLCLAPAGCAISGNGRAAPTAPSERLDLAELRLAEQRPDAALDLIPDEIETQVPLLLQAKALRIQAEAQLALDECWAAYTTLRRFAVDHPLSEERARVQEILYRAGERLITQDTGFWTNTFSDYGSNSGEVILAHLVTTYTQSPRVADAYRLRGDWHLRRREFADANDRFTDLVFARPNSEWVPYANYQIAMSQFFQLSGPLYDLEQIELARQELTELLLNPPERPDFQASAQQALATVNLWICQRHLQIADYYQTVGNPSGERRHLELAVAAGPELEPGQKAAARLAAWEARPDGTQGEARDGTP